MAVPWLLYQLTGSPILLGLGGLFQAVPTFLMVPIAGTLADRLPPRRILVIAQAVALFGPGSALLVTTAGLALVTIAVMASSPELRHYGTEAEPPAPRQPSGAADGALA